MARYEWEDGARFTVQADIVGSIVAEIEEREGVCSPAAFVAAARPKRSPIHSLFTWDDSDAADKWRTHEARNVIRRIRVRIDDVDEPVPAFPRVTRITEDGAESGYMDVVRALSGDHRNEVIQEEIRRLNGIRRRLRAYRATGEVLDALDTAVEGLERIAA